MLELVRSPAHQAGPGYANSEKRYAVMFCARFMGGGRDQPVWGRVNNISAGGLMVVLPRGVRLRGRVAAIVKTVGTFSGRIVWARDDQVGIQFDSPIDPEALLMDRAARLKEQDDVSDQSNAVHARMRPPEPAAPTARSAYA
jgi:hypothetical protein